jgi:acyl-coenzyme A synthetase/AMP-(fatty) acid ligase
VNVALAGPEISWILNDADCQTVFADQVASSDHLLAAFREAYHAGDASTKVVVWMDVDLSAPPPSAEVSAAFGVKGIGYDACLSSVVSSDEDVLNAYRQRVVTEGSTEDGFHQYYTSGTTGHPKVRLRDCFAQLRKISMATGKPAEPYKY